MYVFLQLLLLPIHTKTNFNLFFKGELNFVEIDCIASENEQLCAQHSIETVPTLLFFKNGEKQKKYEEKKTDLERYIISKDDFVVALLICHK